MKWNNPGGGSITVNDTTAAGCVGLPITIPVTIYRIPVINYSIIGDSIACENDIKSYSLSFTPVSVFNWTIVGNLN